MRERERMPWHFGERKKKRESIGVLVKVRKRERESIGVLVKGWSSV